MRGRYRVKIYICKGERSKKYDVSQGKKFTGEASNKKESKTNCAKSALKELHQIEYPEAPAPPGEDDDTYRKALYQEDVPQQFQGFRY